MVQSEKFSPAAQTGIHIVIEFLRLRIPPLFPILHQQGGILLAGGILNRITPDTNNTGPHHKLMKNMKIRVQKKYFKFFIFHFPYSDC